MTDPWAKVATALGHAPDEEDAAEGATAPSGWGTVADRLSGRAGAEPAPDRRRAPAERSERVEKVTAPTAGGGRGTASRPAPDASGDDAAESPARRLRRRRPARPEPSAGATGLGEGAGRRRLRSRWVGTGKGVVAAAVLAGLVIVGLVLYLVWPGGGLPAGTAMSVGGRKVSVAELNGNMNVLSHFYGITAPPQSDKAGYATYLQTQAKAYAIDLVIEQRAAGYHVSVSNSQVNNEFNVLVKSIAGGDTSRLDQMFTQYGLTEAQVRNQIRFQILDNDLFAKVVGSPSVSNAQIQQTYKANLAAVAMPETRAVSHILLADQQTAQSVLTQLQQGGSFAQLAASDSLDTGSKGNGGALGTHAEEELSPAFGQAAFSAPVNVPFGPVDEGNSGTTKNGYDVGLVTAVNPGHPATDDAATQSIIRTYLVGVAENAAWHRWLTGALIQAHVRYAPKYRPAQPTAPPPTQTNASLRQLVLQAADGNATGGSSASPTP